MKFSQVFRSFSKRSFNRTLSFQTLEHRCVLSATMVVNTTGDLPDVNPGDGVAADVNGKTSLRSAIEELNASPAQAGIEIRFDLPSDAIDASTNFGTIPIQSQLPDIQNPVLINGEVPASESDSGQKYRVRLNGSANSSPTMNGLQARADNVRLWNLFIDQFTGDGIEFRDVVGGRVEGVRSSGNGGSGIVLVNAQSMRVGTSLFADNALHGIYLSGSESSNNRLHTNQIGYLVGENDQIIAAGNGLSGIRVESSLNRVFFNDVGFSGGSGVELVGLARTIAAENSVLGNNIGIVRSDPSSAAIHVAPNQLVGLLVESSYNSVRNNLVSGNRKSGIHVFRAQENEFISNRVGTDESGLGVASNGGYGVLVENSSYIRVGGTAENQSNVISGNSQSGVVVRWASEEIQIIGNYIGLDIDGESSLGNGASGIYIKDSDNNHVKENFVSGNVQSQISIIDSVDVIVQDNLVGFSKTIQPINGGTHGILISGGQSSELIRNLITGASNGVTLSSRARQNLISENVIGTDAAVDGDDFGVHTGIRLAHRPNSNQILNNTIAFSESEAIRHSTPGDQVWSSGDRNRISQNRMHDNKFGIELGISGINPNDLNDLDEGTNRYQNSPDINGIVAEQLPRGTMSITVDYHIDSIELHPTLPRIVSNYPITVEFFLSDAIGQGVDYLGTKLFTRDEFEAGTATFNVEIDPSLTTIPIEFLTATATDRAGNSSEFSLPKMIGVATRSLAASASSLDISGDGKVTVRDALIVINAMELQGSESESTSVFVERNALDVNGDRRVSMLDALAIINHINQESDPLSAPSVDRALTNDVDRTSLEIERLSGDLF